LLEGFVLDRIFWVGFVLYTWVDESSVLQLFLGILEWYFRGCSGLFRGDVGRMLEEKWRVNKGKLYQERKYTNRQASSKSYSEILFNTWSACPDDGKRLGRLGVA